MAGAGVFRTPGKASWFFSFGSLAISPAGILFEKGRLTLSLFITWAILLAVVLLVIVVTLRTARWRWGDKSDTDKSGKE